MRRFSLKLAVCATVAALSAIGGDRPRAQRALTPKAQPAAQARPPVAPPPAAPELSLPNAKDSVKFAAIGDNGTGDPPQYEVGKQMAAVHARFPYDFVIMLGD